MANMHALDASNGRFRLVMHVATPTSPATNQAGVVWATAVTRSGRFGSGVSILPAGDGTGGTIGAAEVAQLAAGTLVECVEEILIETAQNNAERLAYVDAAYAAKVSSIQAAILRDLRWFGFTR